MLNLTHSMETTFKRKVSPLERLFLMIAETDPPFCNQMILEGNGTIEESALQKAVEAASEANPGSRLIYTGRSAWAKWVDSGITPPIRTVDGTNWSGYEAEGAPFFFDPVPFRTTNSAEVLIVKGSPTAPTRYVFRTLHATMDAGGTWLWVHDMFRFLRNEPLVGAKSTINDKELMDSLDLKDKEQPRLENCLTPVGGPEGNEPGFTWKRVRLEGKFKKLLPKMALAIAKEAWKLGQGKVLFAIPLELRRRIPDTASTANLSRRIFIEIQQEDTVETITEQVKDKLDNLCADPSFTSFISFVPMGLMKYFTLSSMEKNLQKGFYRDSGTLSNGGLLPIDLLGGGGFEPTGFFWIPPQMQTKPFFLSTVGYNGLLEFVVAMPKVLASNGRLDKFTENVIAQID